MPSGAAVIRYEGPRGVSWRIKYRDAAGKQVQETLGRESDGWTETKAQRELVQRLARVEREHWRKPDRLTFSEFASRFKADYLPGRRLKRSTLLDYGHSIDGHLAPFFEGATLAEIEHEPEILDRYIAAKTAAGLSPKTIRNQAMLVLCS